MIKAIIGGASQLVDTVAGLWNSSQDRKAAKRNTDQTIKAQKELAEYEFDRNYEMWKENNAYNTPTAQMERLRAAGLNPNLVYGSGSVVGNTSGGTPQYRAPNVEYKYKGAQIPDIPNILSYVQGYKINNARLENIERNNTLLKAQADKTYQDINNSILEGISKQRRNELYKYQEEMFKENIRKMKQQFDQRQELFDLNKLKLRYQNTGLNYRLDLLKDQKNLRIMGLDESAHPTLKFFVRWLSGQTIKDLSLPIKFE